MKTNQKQKNIPDGWVFGKVKDFAPLQRGYDLPVKNIYPGDYPVVFSNGSLKMHREYKVKGPGVVTGRSGTIGKVHFIEQNFWPHNTSLWVTDFKGNNPKFVYYFYKQLKLDRFGSGSGVPTLNRNDVHAYKTVFPVTLEQNRIVTVLETWDSGVEKLKQKIAIKKEIKKGLMQELLTGKKRLPGFSGEWREVKLGDISTINMGQSPESQYYNEKNNGLVLIQGNADLKNSKTLDRIYTTQITKTADYGDLIFTVRAPVGAVAYVAQDKVCIGRGVCSIKAKNSYLDFIFYKLKHHTNDFLRYEQGSTFSAINGKDIRNFKIQVPENNEQKVIAKILIVADDEITILEKKLTLWQEQKKYLLNNLVTGQIRTPENLLTTNQ